MSWLIGMSSKALTNNSDNINSAFMEFEVTNCEVLNELDHNPLQYLCWIDPKPHGSNLPFFVLLDNATIAMDEKNVLKAYEAFKVRGISVISVGCHAILPSLHDRIISFHDEDAKKTLLQASDLVKSVIVNKTKRGVGPTAVEIDKEIEYKRCKDHLCSYQVIHHFNNKTGTSSA